jgi:hypothetical protein
VTRLKFDTTLLRIGTYLSRTVKGELRNRAGTIGHNYLDIESVYVALRVV